MERILDRRLLKTFKCPHRMTPMAEEEQVAGRTGKKLC
jgi:hypothetical protein